MSFIRPLVVMLGGLTLVVACTASDPIPPEKLSELQALIKPSAGEEPWATIPWLTDLTQARRIAAEQGKPILLWEMDGHPLGCT
jgi:hypothetical protein